MGKAQGIMSGHNNDAANWGGKQLDFGVCESVPEPQSHHEGFT